jgi:hypothetical protein
MTASDRPASTALIGSRAAPVLGLFVATTFASATLLFSLQPMVAKMVLPAFGGSPAVWNTALVFFQAALLAGYAYAHRLARLRRLRHQLEIHVAVLVVASASLPISVASGWSDATALAPALRLLGLLAVSVGLPFFALSATAPLIQHWFARSGHPHADDPYFLYGASNLGSIIALLGYPLVIEPRLALGAQSEAWSLSYLAAAALIAGCGIVTATRNRKFASVAAERVAAKAPALSWRCRAGWMACSAVPSALLLGVTSHITTDLAAVPLLWVGPLALYLLTFVIAFARRPPVPHVWVVKIFPYAVTLLACAFVIVGPAALLVPLHLLVFFITALLCHGELARRRPATERLTDFYLYLSLGGVLGGMATALLAPAIFDTVYEYPLALAAACLILPGVSFPVEREDIAFAAAVGLITFGVREVLAAIGLVHGAAVSSILIAIGALVAFGRKERPTSFALGLGVTLLAAAVGVHQSDTILRARSFFGAYRIAVSADGTERYLMHGTTIHGAQHLDPARRKQPASYYASDSPIAELIAKIQDAHAAPRIGVVGLGAGSLACYRRSADRWTFYEIDPLVVRLATDDRYFSFLKDCADRARIVVGDARLKLAAEPDERFSLLVIDAFTSDSIPLHLITREALALYVDKLAEGGILVIHISNRHLDLEPVLARAIAALGLVGRSGRKAETSADGISSAASHWIAMAREATALDRLNLGEHWQPIGAADGQPAWTDTYSNILSALRW